MNRIDAIFRKLGRQRKPAFIAYITAGDPNLQTTQRLVPRLADSGCDIIELGIPFSDPLADGVVNQRAAQRALASGTTLSKILVCVGRLRKTTQLPLILFSYFNPIHRMGLVTFARKAAAAGVDGALILDLPPEESRETRKVLRQHGMHMIYLIAPTSSKQRIKKICAKAKGFIYCVSRTGVTGAQRSDLAEVRDLVRRVKKQTKLPIAVGFGISKPQDVHRIGSLADGVVVGSAIVSCIEKNPKNLLASVERFVQGLTRALENRHA